MAGNWSVVVPEATTNYVVNPSFAANITDGWTNYSTGTAGGDRQRLNNYQKFNA